MAGGRRAVVCQVYPRSFRDSDGDGVVDLPALLEKLPYLASLGVDGAVAVAGVRPAQTTDNGYDCARQSQDLWRSFAPWRTWAA